MERQDYLERQIQQLARALSKIISDFLGLKSHDVNDALEKTNHSLKEKLGFDFQDIIKISNEDFITIIQNDNSFNVENLDKLADLIYIIAENKTGIERKILFEKSLTIINYIEKTQSIYSLERQTKKDKIYNNLDLIKKN